ncbi:uncharacterized protein LOC128266417 isoform X1 [Drosophila gunungcola]|uniref:uncharacterized protein LOC128266417 isoform X1 n=1 Tax=Drosophila gunungcola TaxID=103775 RepID=UPI0022E96436|nr:uncharacterized protein LOC128266417 isoform X1 [Drosophila gunungcola]
MSQSTERRTMIQEKRKLMEDKRMNMGMKSFCASFIGTNFRPSDDPRNSFSSMMRRHIADKQFVDASYEANDEEVFEPIYQTEFDDDRDLKLEPTFSKHRIPLQIRCLERYHNSKREYAQQFKREIKLLIDNQSTAENAWQFVRTMAYTSLWPPLHTRKELKMFEKDFCKLSPTEQRRFNKIMATDFS